MLSPSACTVTTWLCVDTFHSVVFDLCKYRHGDSSRKLLRENLPFSWVLNQQFHFRLNCHNNFDYPTISLSTFSQPCEEWVVQYWCQAWLCESFNDNEINSRLHQRLFISWLVGSQLCWEYLVIETWSNSWLLAIACDIKSVWYAC